MGGVQCGSAASGIRDKIALGHTLTMLGEQLGEVGVEEGSHAASSNSAWVAGMTASICSTVLRI